MTTATTATNDVVRDYIDSLAGLPDAHMFLMCEWRPGMSEREKIDPDADLSPIATSRKAPRRQRKAAYVPVLGEVVDDPVLYLLTAVADGGTVR